MKKFMQVLDERIYRDLTQSAKSRGIGVQELLRSIVIPAWIRKEKQIDRVFKTLHVKEKQK